MRLYILLFLTLILCHLPLQGQRQADNWVYGICTPEDGCPEPYGSGVLRFSESGIESITSKYFGYLFNKGSATISDSLGNLLLAFNGKYLFDSTGAIIDSFYVGDFFEMPIGFKNSLFLNVPGNSNNYCLFNSYADVINNPLIIEAFDSSFYYTEFTTYNNGIETLIRKQPIVLDSSAAGTIAAVRHANGRDWWIIKSSVYQDKFYQALLDPSGFEFYPIFTPIPHLPQPGGGWNLFSSDGSKFVNIITGFVRKAYVYDFNRCTGEITNPVEYDLSNYFNEDVTNACCLSPDGTKLYFRRSNMEALLTIELCQYDFETSTFSVIAEANTAPCTTPNNKWVIAGYTDISGNPFIPQLSVIYSPNEPAAECDFQEGVYNMINYGFVSVSPNCANFRLGALAGSPCDTLFTGISNVKNLNFKIYPNPVESSLTIELDNLSLNELRITDLLGRTIWREKNYNQKTVLNKEIEGLKLGIYWLEVHDLKTGKRRGTKFIKR